MNIKISWMLVQKRERWSNGKDERESEKPSVEPLLVIYNDTPRASRESLNYGFTVGTTYRGNPLHMFHKWWFETILGNSPERDSRSAKIQRRFSDDLPLLPK